MNRFMKSNLTSLGYRTANVAGSLNAAIILLVMLI
jgi:hypothetical protein